MATQPKTTGLTYEDLRAYPDDNLRRELIDGELVVTPSPSYRHQRVVVRLTVELFQYEKDHGGRVVPAPLDVYFSDASVVEPDVLFVREESLAKIEPQFIRSAPDLVVEVSSPSTRRLELTRKRDLYERFAVPEYWFIDLEAERVEVYRLVGGRYENPTLLRRHEALTSPILPGFALSVDELLGESED
jgi:Uma2 family endonuclease